MLLALILSSYCAAAPQWLDNNRPPLSPPAPQRIVILAPSLTEVVFALGRGGNVVGVTRYDDFPPEAIALPKMGGLIDPNIETIVAARPNLVLALQSGGTAARLRPLQRFDIPVLLLPDESLDELFTTITALGVTLAAEEVAIALSSRLKQQLQQVQQAYAKSPNLAAAVVVGRRPVVLAGRDTFLHSVLVHLNLRNVASARGFPSVDLEALNALEPDLLIDLSRHERQQRHNDQFWQRLPWHRQGRGRLLVIQDTALLRPGPRLGDALERLGKTIRGSSTESEPRPMSVAP